MIDLKEFERSELQLEVYVLLYYLHLKDKRAVNSLKSIDSFDYSGSLLYLKNNGYVVEQEDGDVIVREKGEKVFENNSDIDFDRFYTAYPYRVPSPNNPAGRLLRSSNKEFNGRLTNEYKTARKKYLARVKTKKEDDLIYSILSAKLQKCSKNDLMYMKQIINYIEQEEWQKDYIHLDSNSSFEEKINSTSI